MNDANPPTPTELRGWLMLPADDADAASADDPFGFSGVRLAPGVVTLDGEQITAVTEDPKALRDEADHRRLICRECGFCGVAMTTKCGG
ncbi:MAG: hypothetical protein AAF916_12685 [Planctomycetota bacterium]